MGLKFQCQECDYNATRKGDLLTNHRSIHTSQKFLCPECDFQAIQKDSHDVLTTLASTVKVTF